MRQNQPEYIDLQKWVMKNRLNKDLLLNLDLPCAIQAIEEIIFNFAFPDWKHQNHISITTLAIIYLFLTAD